MSFSSLLVELLFPNVWKNEIICQKPINIESNYFVYNNNDHLIVERLNKLENKILNNMWMESIEDLYFIFPSKSTSFTWSDDYDSKISFI